MEVSVEPEAVTSVPQVDSVVVATVLREFGGTGVQTHFNEFCRYLKDSSLRVRLVNPYCLPKFITHPLFAPRVILDRVHGPSSVRWYRRWHYLTLKIALERELRDHGPCVVYAQCPLSAWAALEARQSDSQRVVLAVHFNRSHADEWRRHGKLRRGDRLYQEIKVRESRVFSDLDGIVFVSQYMKEILETDHPGLERVASVVLPNFIEDPGLPDEKTAVESDLVNIGALEPLKNQSFLLRVLREANKLGHRYTLSLIGYGPELEKLKATSRELEVADQVSFCGYQEDAAAQIPKHSLYVHSATNENFPLVLVEAMAYGVPVLAGAVGGIPEVFREGIDGALWDLDRPESAARTLIALMEDKKRREAMGHAARERFVSELSSAAAVPRLCRFLGLSGY